MNPKILKAALPPILLLTIWLAASARAAQLPLWEAGIGATAINFPDYRGSDERQTWLLPFPYLVYRGEFLQADERRMRGLFFKTDRFEVDVSANGSVPVDSSKNSARLGMPDLDPTLEIGPAVNVLLASTAGDRTRLELRMPVRAVLASDFSYVRQVGWVFQPHLNADIQDPAGLRGWKLGVLGGPLYTDRRYGRYFYAVDPAFATATRPAYSPGGGYGGMQFIVALSKRYRNYWVGGFLKWDQLNGAAFEDSPLVRDKQSFSGGIAIAWILGKSKTLVEAPR